MADRDEKNDLKVGDYISSLDLLDDFGADFDFLSLLDELESNDNSNDVQTSSPSTKRTLVEVEEIEEPSPKELKRSLRYEDLLGKALCGFTDELEEMKGVETVESQELAWIRQYLEKLHQTSDPIEVFTWIVDTFAEIPPGKALAELKERASVLGLTDFVTYLNHLPYLPISTSKLEEDLKEATAIEQDLKAAETFIQDSSNKKKQKGGKKTKKAVKTGEPENARKDIEELLEGTKNGAKSFRMALVGKMQTSKSRIAQQITRVEGLSGDNDGTSGTTTVPLMIVPIESGPEYYVDFYLNDPAAIEKRQNHLRNKTINLAQLAQSLKNNHYEEDDTTFTIPALKSTEKRRDKNFQFTDSVEFKELLLCRVLYSPVRSNGSSDTRIEVLDFPGYNDTANPDLCKAYAATLLSIPNFVNITALCVQNRGATEPEDIKFLLDAGVFDLRNPHIVVAYWKSDDRVNSKKKEHAIRKAFRNQVAALFGVKPTQGTVIDAAANKELIDKSDDVIHKHRVHKWLSYTCQSIAWDENSVSQLIQLYNTASFFNMQLAASRYFDSLKFKCLEIKGLYRNDLIGFGKFKTARENIDEYLREEKFRIRVREWKDEVLAFLNDESNPLNALPGMLGILIERCSNAYRVVASKPNLSDIEKVLLSIYEKRVAELKLKQESLNETLEDLDREELKRDFSSIADDLLETNGTELLAEGDKLQLVQRLKKSRIQKKQSSYMKRINKLIRGGKTVADYSKAMSEIPWGQPYPEVNRVVNPKFSLVSDLFLQASAKPAEIKSRYRLITEEGELKSTAIRPTVNRSEDNDSRFFETEWNTDAKTITFNISESFYDRITRLHADAVNNKYDGEAKKYIYPIFIPTVASRDSSLLQNTLNPDEVDSLVIAVIDPKDLEIFRNKPEFQEPFSQNNRLVFLVAPIDYMGLGRVRSLMLLLAYSLGINYFWMIDDDVDTENIQEWDAILETVAKSSLSRALCYTQNIMRWEIASRQEIQLEPVTHEDLKSKKVKELQALAKEWGIIGSKLPKESLCNAIVNKSNAIEQLRHVGGREAFINELTDVDGVLRMRDLWNKYPKENFNHTAVTKTWSTDAKQREIINDPSLVLTNLPSKSDIHPEDKTSLDTLAWVKKGLSSSIDFVAQVALWNRHSFSQKCRYHDLIRTDTSHYLANVRRQVVLFNAAAMNGLLYVNDEEFFLPPPQDWRAIKYAAEKDKQKKASESSKLAMKLGYHFDDFFLAEQLFYYGKNGFQTIRFSFVGKMWPSTFTANDQLDIESLIDQAEIIKAEDWTSPKFNYALDVLQTKLASYHMNISPISIWEAFIKHHNETSDNMMEIMRKYPFPSAKPFGENKNLTKAVQIKKGNRNRLMDLAYLVSAYKHYLKAHKKEATIAVCVLWLDNNKVTISIVGVKKYATGSSLRLVYHDQQFYEITDDAPQQLAVDPVN